MKQKIPKQDWWGSKTYQKYLSFKFSNLLILPIGIFIVLFYWTVCFILSVILI